MKVMCRSCCAFCFKAVMVYLPQPRVAFACRYIMQTYVRPNLVFTHGEGARMYDAAGKEYLDFAAGIAVNALGAPHKSCILSKYLPWHPEAFGLR